MSDVLVQKSGLYPSLSNEEYHAEEAISRSGIMMFLDSPYKYWAHYINPDRPAKESTSAMDFGSAFHTYVLEPHLFEKHYAIEPTRVLLKDGGREAYEEYKNEMASLESTNKIILSADQMSVLNDMRTALQMHTDAWVLIQDAVYEQSYFWQDKESGLWVKSRPDILHPNMIVDLKTCAEASTRSYRYAMVDSGYHIQGAMVREAVRCTEGKDIPNVINICIEKKYPYEIGIKLISEAALDEGHRQYKKALINIKQCIETNYWPSYEVETVELPSWYS